MKLESVIWSLVAVVGTAGAVCAVAGAIMALSLVPGCAARGPAVAAAVTSPAPPDLTCFCVDVSIPESCACVRGEVTASLTCPDGACPWGL